MPKELPYERLVASLLTLVAEPAMRIDRANDGLSSFVSAPVGRDLGLQRNAR
jgi:hypothetical protein